MHQGLYPPLFFAMPLAEWSCGFGLGVMSLQTRVPGYRSTDTGARGTSLHIRVCAGAWGLLCARGPLLIDGGVGALCARAPLYS